MQITDFRNTGYEALFVAITASFIAQIIKFFFHLIVKRKVDLRLFTTTGGMPSAHSACVVGLSSIVGFQEGFDSLIFAIAMTFALIIMYDAAGLRRAAGKTAACLNRMMDDFYQHNTQQMGEKLKELLGHTPFEVFVGAVWGFLYAYLIHYIVF